MSNLTKNGWTNFYYWKHLKSLFLPFMGLLNCKLQLFWRKILILHIIIIGTHIVRQGFGGEKEEFYFFCVFNVFPSSSPNFQCVSQDIPNNTILLSHMPWWKLNSHIMFQKDWWWANQSGSFEKKKKNFRCTFKFINKNKKGFDTEILYFIKYYLDLSKVYDFKFCIFVHPNFWKDTFGFNYMSKDALFD